MNYQNSVLASYTPRCSIFITSPSGDMLWDTEELKRAYPRLGKAIMKQVREGKLHYCRNNIKVYFITMYQGGGYESN